jgi:hypothetical protein
MQGVGGFKTRNVLPLKSISFELGNANLAKKEENLKIIENLHLSYNFGCIYNTSFSS